MFPAVPNPNVGERPTEYADRVGMWYVEQKSNEHRKEHGLYLTSVIVADYMAEKIQVNEPKLRILDPAAGSGILCCAAVESLISRNPKPTTIELVVYEVDKGIINYLQVVLKYLTDWCERNYRVKVSVSVKAVDFIIANAEVLQLQTEQTSDRTAKLGFDVVISNPPYFKINKGDPRASVVSTVVHGQPNIYALFMAVSAVLLRKRGDFIFITPRSFTSGFYFQQFRAFFFNLICPIAVHVFGSRREAFSRDDVLQENIILFGKRQENWYRTERNFKINISSSRGVCDINERTCSNVSINLVLDLNSQDMVLRLPLSGEEDVLNLVDSWPCTIHSLGLKISTGPVVPFRAATLVDREGDVPVSHVPLLWMNHIQAMKTTWPLFRHKPEYIKRLGAEALLLPNKNYVLLRRFSSKEQPRRLTAAPYLAKALNTPEVGFENHLNYIHRPDGQLSYEETLGLAILYNSRLLDTYFRAVNGNTQVSATELRSIPLPAHKTIVELGRRVKHLSDPTQDIDLHVMTLLGQPELKEVSLG